MSEFLRGGEPGCGGAPSPSYMVSGSTNGAAVSTVGWSVNRLPAKKSRDRPCLGGSRPKVVEIIALSNYDELNSLNLERTSTWGHSNGTHRIL